MTEECMLNEFIVACHASREAVQMSDVCEMAHKMLVTLHPEITEHHEPPCEVSGMTEYTPASQALFDTYYDLLEQALKQAGFTQEFWGDWLHEWVFTESESP